MGRDRRSLQHYDPMDSKHQGIHGFFELVLRRFKILAHALTLIPLYGIASLCIGVSLIPGVTLFKIASQSTQGMPFWVHYSVLALALGTGYFLYGFSLIFIVPLMNFLLRCKLSAWRGAYYSLACVPWYIHNGLTYLVRFTFLEFITPTPYNLLFYKMMGMKIGRGSQINSVNISDPCLIELGEKVTIGGSATVVAHYGMAGFLVIAPVQIKTGATIGLKATIMGGVEIGEYAKVLPNSVVLPKTKIPAGETWGGVPAQKIQTKQKRQRKPKSEISIKKKAA